MSEPITIQAHPDLVLDLQDGGVRQIYFKGKPMLYSDLARFGEPNNEYFGQFVSPVAGRIKKGVIEGYHFAPNERGNALHGSQYSLCWKDYSRRIEVKTSEICVEFQRIGTYFGGDYVSVARYILDRKSPKFRMELSFKNTVDCPVNLTSHCYFSLGATDVEDVALKMPAAKVMAYDDELIPLGFIDAQGRFDFRKGRKLSFPMDHAFLLQEGLVKAWTKDVLLCAKTNAHAVVMYLDYPSHESVGHSKGFTLEFVMDPMLGKKMILPAGKEHLVSTEYTFQAL